MIHVRTAMDNRIDFFQVQVERILQDCYKNHENFKLIDIKYCSNFLSNYEQMEYSAMIVFEDGEES